MKPKCQCLNHSSTREEQDGANNSDEQSLMMQVANMQAANMQVANMQVLIKVMINQAASPSTRILGEDLSGQGANVSKAQSSSSYSSLHGH